MTIQFDFTGRTVIVTGGARGIGRAIVVGAVVHAQRQQLRRGGGHHRATPRRVTHDDADDGDEGSHDRLRLVVDGHAARLAGEGVDLAVALLQGGGHLLVRLAALGGIPVRASLRQGQVRAQLVGEAAGEDESEHRGPGEGAQDGARTGRIGLDGLRHRRRREQRHRQPVNPCLPYHRSPYSACAASRSRIAAT